MLKQTLSVLLLTSSIAFADEAGPRTTLALTTTVEVGATEAEVERSKALLVLLEAEASLQPGFSVVERQQIDLALHELLISQTLGKDAANQLQLGKLATADLIVSTKLLNTKTDQEQRALIRVTEPLTGVIRGATAILIHQIDVEEAAEQIMHYVQAVVESPKLAGITVSVAPFESEAQFHHVRPLELIIRDVLTTQLREAGGFQVLQRTDMGSLLDELDLVRAGLIDAGDLPETLPSREGTYHIRGTIDERYDDQGLVVLINAELMHAVSGRSVLKLGMESRPQTLGMNIAAQVERIGSFLSDSKGSGDRKLTEFDESRTMVGLAVRDVRRLKRNSTNDLGYTPFRLPGFRAVYAGRPSVEMNTPVADHLLRKSIDRLETVLFLHPERRDVAYTLAWCYSFHRRGIFQPERAERLLKDVFQTEPKSSLSVLAFKLLAELYVSHDGQSIVPEKHRQDVVERMRYVIRTISPDVCPPDVSRWAVTMEKVHLADEDYQGYVESYETINRFAKQKEYRYRKYLMSRMSFSLQKFLRNSDAPQELKPRVRILMADWSKQDDPLMKEYGDLIKIGRTGSAEAMVDFYLKKGDVRYAAHYLLNSKQSEKALKLLQSVDVSQYKSDHDRGHYLMTLGRCLEARNQNTEALDAYVQAAGCGRYFLDNTSVQKKIQDLGGVPLRPDRDFDLTYVPISIRNVYSRTIAADESRLYCGALHTSAKPVSGIVVFDIEQRRFDELPGMDHHVTCLERIGNELWIGTSDAGMWKLHIPSHTWTQYAAEQGLPFDHVTAITVNGDSVFVSGGEVTSRGRIMSGGVAELEGNGKISILQQGKRPPVAATQMVMHDGQLLAVASRVLYSWSVADQRWQRAETQAYAVFRGQDKLWSMKAPGRVGALQSYDSDATIENPVWDSTGYDSRMYTPAFLIESGQNLWFGGRSWKRFVSSGFFRVDKATGESVKYGPRDGFRSERGQDFSCYDGVIVDGQIWLATLSGLAEVSIRRPSGNETSTVSEYSSSQIPKE